MKKRLLLTIITALNTVTVKSITLTNNSSNSFIQNQISTTINSDGVLDQGFNKLGTSSISGFIFGDAGYYSNDQIYALAIQQDGKIVVGGYTIGSDTGYWYFALARYLPTGQLDSDFGATTQWTTSKTPGTVYINGFIAGSSADSIRSLAIQSDGRIVVGGQSNNRFALACFLPDGTLDSSFGQNIPGVTGSSIPGTVYVSGFISGNPSDIIESLVLQSDKSIIAGGTSNGLFAVARFLPNGTLDSSFGQNIAGSTASSIAGTVYIVSQIAGGGNDIIASLALQKDDSLVAGGVSRDGGGQNHWALARFLSNGSLDASFGQNVPNSTTSSIPGTVYLSGYIGNGYSDYVHQVAIQVDGNIITAGQSDHQTGLVGGRGHFAVARFTPQGALDETFGYTTENTTSYIPGTVFVNKSISGAALTQMTDYGYSVVLQADGKLLVAGLTRQDTLGNAYFGLARFTPQGILDPSFGGTGANTISVFPGTCFIPHSIAGAPFGAIQDYSYSSAIQPDGKIATGGYSADAEGHLHFAIARFFNPTTPTSYQQAYTSVGSGANC